MLPKRIAALLLLYFTRLCLKIGSQFAYVQWCCRVGVREQLLSLPLVEESHLPPFKGKPILFE